MPLRAPHAALWKVPADEGQYALPPGSGDVDITPATGHPAAGNPNNPAPRRVDPAASHPHIPSSVPPIVARDPNPSGMQRWSWPFNNNGWWWACMNDDLRICRKHAKSNPAHGDQDAFFHSHKASNKSETFEKHIRISPSCATTERKRAFSDRGANYRCQSCTAARPT